MIFRRLKKGSNKGRLYADAAASTPLSEKAREALMLGLEAFGNPGGLHDEGQAAKAILEDARERIANAIGAHSDEIFFTASGTEANNLAIFGALKGILETHGEAHAITSSIEHPSVLEPLRALEADGSYLTVLPVNGEGLVSPEDLREAMNEETALVSVQMVNSEIGTIEPIREIAKEIRNARKARHMPIYFHSDASQAPLWLPLQVEKLGCDLLTLDAQKVMGPKGVGILYIRRGSDIAPLIYGGGQEEGLRSGTPNAASAISFAAALEEAQQNAEANTKNIAEVRDHCFTEIKKLIPAVVMNGPTAEHRVANNLNISVPGLDAQMAVIALNTHGIAASTRSACDVGDEEPSHVMLAIGMPIELAGTAIRFTFLPNATKKDALRIAEALKKVADRYKLTN